MSLPPADPRNYPIPVQAYRDANHQWLADLDEFTVNGPKASPGPRQRMGIRRVTPADWLLADGHHDFEVSLKRKLVNDLPSEVVAVVPGQEKAITEAGNLVTQWVGANGPPGSVVPSAIGEDRTDRRGFGAEPLIEAALSVQEDLCVMAPDPNGHWRLVAGVVCFPTYWRLNEKIGLEQAAVHGPVPHYENDLALRVSTFFDRLNPDRIMARRNWGLSADPLLFLPDSGVMSQPAEFNPDQIWIRSEYQTLRRLPQSGAVLFTIRVQLAPLDCLLDRTDLADRLVRAIEAWTPELLASRGGHRPWFGQAVDWMRSI